MGQIKRSKVIALIACLLLTGLLLSLEPGSAPSVKKQKMADILNRVGDWQGSGQSSMSPEIVESLQLDDYVFRNYTNGKETIFLYIGYYASAGKIGAAHDPLVCFPGQGMVLTDKTTGVIPIAGPPDKRVNYSSFISTQGLERQYVLYWFQAYNTTNASTFAQKIFLLASKFRGDGQDNAFVRITMPMDNRSPAECQKVIASFVRDFYPLFLAYIEEKNG